MVSIKRILFYLESRRNFCTVIGIWVRGCVPFFNDGPRSDDKGVPVELFPGTVVNLPITLKLICFILGRLIRACWLGVS